VFFVFLCMKPSVLFLLGTICIPATMLASAGLPGHTEADRHNSIASQTLIASSELPSVWARVRFEVSLESLASQLDIPAERLAELNGTGAGRSFNSNDWVALPQRSKESIRLVAALDDSDLRSTSPHQGPAGLLAKVMRLPVDLPGRLLPAAQARPTLGLLPGGSGSLSWPLLPGFGPQNPPRSLTRIIWPTQGTLTSGYGWRWGRMHKGIDVANSVGTPVVAVSDGVVLSSGWNAGGYGYLVEVSHEDGTVTRYAHNSRLLVTKGMTVSQGTPIALMGSTGRSTGPHLHFEIHSPGQGAINPMLALAAKS
jgi:murein DD-endopeptidase MepM/ murein hydrolase activator NlpD